MGVACRYDFEAYTEASEKMYRVFLRYAPVVMAVSCDEAFMELAEGTDPMEAATRVSRILGTSHLLLLPGILFGWQQLAHRGNGLPCGIILHAVIAKGCLCDCLAFGFTSLTAVVFAFASLASPARPDPSEHF